MSNRKKVLVCGATGFLGRNVAETFAKDDRYEVTGTYWGSEPYHHPKIKMVKADLTQKHVVNELVPGHHIVLDYAAIATNFKDVVTRPYIHTTDNIIMTNLMIRAAHDHKVEHFVFPSCGYLYNDSPVPFKETDVDYNNLPSNYFAAAWSKVYCEKMCEFYSSLGNCKYTVIRQANIFGPYDKLNQETAHALPATIMKVINSKDGALEVWGDGTQLKDIIYVTDLMDLLERVVDRKQNKFDFINAGSAGFISMKEIAESVIRASKKDIKISYNTSKPSYSKRWTLDYSKAKELFGWSPKANFDEGVKKTYDWYASVLK